MSNLSDFKAIPLSPITIEYTGRLLYPFVFNVINQIGVQIVNDIFEASGKCVEGFGNVGLDVPSTTYGLTTVSFTDLVGVKNDFYLIGGGESNFVTDLGLGSLELVGGAFEIQHHSLITALDLSSLIAVGGYFHINTMPLLETVDISSLKKVGGDFLVTGALALSAISAPALEFIGETLQWTGIPLVTTISFPSLVNIVGAFETGDDEGGATILSEIQVPILENIGGAFNPANCPSLTSISLPSIKTFGSAILMDIDMAALTTFTLGANLLSIGGDITITSPTLPEANVDALLVQLAGLDGTNGTTSYNNHTIDLSGNCAAPSATGLAAKAVLEAEGRGNTVTVNS